MAPARVNRSLRAVLATVDRRAAAGRHCPAHRRGADPTTPAQVEKRDPQGLGARPSPSSRSTTAFTSSTRRTRRSRPSCRRNSSHWSGNSSSPSCGSAPSRPRCTRAARPTRSTPCCPAARRDMLADRLSYLDQMAREQQRQLAGVTQLKAQYDAQKAPIDKLVATLAQQDADLRQEEEGHRGPDHPAAEAAPRRRTAAPAPSGPSGRGRARRPTSRPTATRWRPSPASRPASRTSWAADGPGSYDCSGLTLGRVETGRRVPAAPVAGAARVHPVREPGQPEAGRSRLLLQPDPSRRRLRGRRQDHARAVRRRQRPHGRHWTTPARSTASADHAGVESSAPLAPPRAGPTPRDQRSFLRPRPARARPACNRLATV